MLLLIRDQLQIKTLQRLLKRELTPAEANGRKAIEYRDQNGIPRITRIKLYPLSYFYTRN